MEEVWKNINDNYQISESGKVKSLSRIVMHRGRSPILSKERILIPYKSKGYLMVTLCSKKIKKTYQVHQLVAMVFLNHIPNGHNLVVNHKDFNKLNNHYTNLEIISSRENTNRLHLKSTSKFVGVSKASRGNKWIAKIYINKRQIHLGSFNNEIEASRYYENALKSFKSGNKIIVKPNNFTSKHRGVSYDSTRSKWMAQISINGKINQLGRFETEIEAHKAYQLAKDNNWNNVYSSPALKRGTMGTIKIQQIKNQNL